MNGLSKEELQDAMGTGGYRPSMRGAVPDWLQNVVGGGLDMLGMDKAADYVRPGGGGRATGTPGRNPMAYSSPDWMVDSASFDAADPDQVLKMQQMLNRLGYKDRGGEQLEEDARMGGKTESAYRQWIEDRKDVRGEDTLRYDYNESQPRKGMLGRAYTNLDKKLGGYLPGGYRRDMMDQSAEDYANR